MSYSIFSKNKNRDLPRKMEVKRGFTLVELMVVITIVTIITTAVVVQQNSWNDSLVVSTQAYELALMIRQAQIYSLGVREDVAGSGDKFNVGYGVHFDSTKTRYIFFADRDSGGGANEKYDSSPNEAVETKTFTRGVTIDRICGIKGGGENCSNPLSKIDISFFRPDTKANISFLNGGGNAAPGFGPPATIYLKSPGGKQYKVKVETNGQISVTPI
jgi:prepilin-type N-terminal cleavage/methylation domain-containing protein